MVVGYGVRASNAQCSISLVERPTLRLCVLGASFYTGATAVLIIMASLTALQKSGKVVVNGKIF